MVKVNGPAMSLDASGSLGGALVFSKWKGRPYVRVLVKPANPKSALQTSMRAMFKFLSQQWAGLSGADKATWEAKAEQLVASPFNAFVSVNQERWRNYLAPSMDDPAAGGVSDTVLTSFTATAGVRQITLDITAGETSGTAWGCWLHRDLTTSFTPSISNVIAVIPAADSVAVTYVDTPLDPDQYFYRATCFDIDGAQLLNTAEVNATVA